MRFPSIVSLAQMSSATFRRFPVAILFSVADAILLSYLSHHDLRPATTGRIYWKLAESCYLGMLLHISVPLFCEQNRLGTAKTILANGIGLAVVAIYYFSLPDVIYTVSYIRLTLFALGLHFLIAFVPYLQGGDINGFWQYNKTLFLRVLAAFLYAGVLYAGLSIALLSLQYLFKLDIDGKLYLDLWLFLGTVFNTWFFLAGFPKDFEALESMSDYPKGLKFFTQYVLLPIITLYLLILYAYLIKILVSMQWPVGWVSYLVLDFSVAGILSLLLIHPIGNLGGNKWIPLYSKYFHIAILPLVGLLFFAIARRVMDYGITELRYFVMLLAAWLFLISLYFIFARTKNIKLIPVSLCLLAFGSSFGPWGAFSVSVRCQKNHLTDLLTKNHLLVNGKWVKALSRPSGKDLKEISSIVEYLVEYHGPATLQPLFVQNLDSLEHEKRKEGDKNYMPTLDAEGLMDLVCLKYLNRYSGDDNLEERFYLNTGSRYGQQTCKRISGYDYLLEGIDFDRTEKNDRKGLQCGSDSLTVMFLKEKNQLVLRMEGTAIPSLSFDLAQLATSAAIQADGKSAHEVASKYLSLETNVPGLICRVQLESLNWELSNNKMHVTSLRGDILLALVNKARQ